MPHLFVNACVYRYVQRPKCKARSTCLSLSTFEIHAPRTCDAMRCTRIPANMSFIETANTPVQSQLYKLSVLCTSVHLSTALLIIQVFSPPMVSLRHGVRCLSTRCARSRCLTRSDRCHLAPRRCCRKSPPRRWYRWRPSPLSAAERCPQGGLVQISPPTGTAVDNDSHMLSENDATRNWTAPSSPARCAFSRAPRTAPALRSVPSMRSAARPCWIRALASACRSCASCMTLAHVPASKRGHDCRANARDGRPSTSARCGGMPRAMPAASMAIEPEPQKGSSKDGINRGDELSAVLAASFQPEASSILAATVVRKGIFPVQVRAHV